MLPSIDDIADNFDLLDEWEALPLPDRARPADAGPARGGSAEANRVQGCASQVWIDHRRGAGPEAAGSPSGRQRRSHRARPRGTPRGAVHGKTPSEIAKADPLDFFDQLGLGPHLTAQRSNGVRAMVDRIHGEARGSPPRPDSRVRRSPVSPAAGEAPAFGPGGSARARNARPAVQGDARHDLAERAGQRRSLDPLQALQEAAEVDQQARRSPRPRRGAAHPLPRGDHVVGRARPGRAEPPPSTRGAPKSDPIRGSSAAAVMSRRSRSLSPKDAGSSSGAPSRSRRRTIQARGFPRRCAGSGRLRRRPRG